MHLQHQLEFVLLPVRLCVRGCTCMRVCMHMSVFLVYVGIQVYVLVRRHVLDVGARACGCVCADILNMSFCLAWPTNFDCIWSCLRRELDAKEKGNSEYLRTWAKVYEDSSINTVIQ